MIELKVVKYSQLHKKELNQLFKLRKKTFKDRLNWEVACIGDMEMDKYDNINATYIIGVSRNEIFCGARLIHMSKPNMTRDQIFKSYFDKEIIINNDLIEVSRFFIDKDKIKSLLIEGSPLASLMFISMINHARNELAKSMCAIVSTPMYAILHRAGWNAKIIQSGVSEKHETIHYVTLPIDEENTSRLYEREVKLIQSSVRSNTKEPVLIYNI